ncbi:MAG TPA: transcriptional regulator [Porphyromonadaceae bacterium]|jgi:DNA-binding XRE family transcriptional regulator|nr:transcriptional regulator [Porphyromonadaceae bacterium]HBK31496.1 transcriptional regulator [Porphyromonadaceae bacterium]HBL33895.1 transcriptional regulator [Porphyromonadaceae bacterium]HBX19446.1 transcriptional regulator [Porphyromonadaceae bacterium]HCM19469.1 transcriptional regulator [Porphyromonadaceae bacterium]
MSTVNTKDLKSLDQFVDEQYGKRGTEKRETFEKGYERFKLGFILQQARLERGMTQEKLAEKVGTNKGYISRVENNMKDVRISTLQKIIEKGFGGHLELTIKCNASMQLYFDGGNNSLNFYSL